MLFAGANDPAAELPSLAQVANGVAGRHTNADTSASSTSLALNSHFGEAAVERTSPDLNSEPAPTHNGAHLQVASKTGPPKWLSNVTSTVSHTSKMQGSGSEPWTRWWSRLSGIRRSTLRYGWTGISRGESSQHHLGRVALTRAVSITECLADAAGTEVRAGAYRLLRHLMVDASDAVQLTRHHLEYFLVKYVIPSSTSARSLTPVSPTGR